MKYHLFSQGRIFEIKQAWILYSTLGRFDSPLQVLSLGTIVLYPQSFTPHSRKENILKWSIYSWQQFQLHSSPKGGNLQVMKAYCLHEPLWGVFLVNDSCHCLLSRFSVEYSTGGGHRMGGEAYFELYLVFYCWVTKNSTFNILKQENIYHLTQ